MFALILQRASMPMAMGSRLVWLTLAGMTMRPRATSSRMSSGSSLLALRHAAHLGRDHALPRVVHLASPYRP